MNPKDYPHLRFLNPIEGVTTHRYSHRSYEETEESKKKDDAKKILNFRKSMVLFFKERQRRSRERNETLHIPAEIECIELQFYNSFDIPVFENHYRGRFGLSPVRYFDHNRKALFAVSDSELFDCFLDQVRKFIACKNHQIPDYYTRLRFIDTFNFHSTERIIQNQKRKNDVTFLSLLQNQELIQDQIPALKNALFEYLDEHNIEHLYDHPSETIAVWRTDNESLVEIARNFDIVHRVNSVSSSIIRSPGKFGTPESRFPFAIAKLTEDLPIVGVIDTGISDQTPLSDLIIDDDSYNLTTSHSMIDEADRGYGHGTGTAGFVALGDQLRGKVEGTLEPQARLLSMKVLSENSGLVIDFEVIELIRRAHDEHGVRIFVLTICHDRPNDSGTTISDYARNLDKLSSELDILIMISTANFFFASDHPGIVDHHPDHILHDSEGNFCSPADSLNNLTVGALAGNMEKTENDSFHTAATDEDIPTIFTRKFQYDYTGMGMKNSHLIKPDILYYGENYSICSDGMGSPFLEHSSPMGLQYLTAYPGVIFERQIGTSFSAALIGNMAANILRIYSEIRMQSVKALIINSCDRISQKSLSSQIEINEMRSLCGHGLPDMDRCLFSSPDEVTMILEDQIGPDEIKSYPVHIPEYLAEIEKEKEMLKITGTLCFAFSPVTNDDLAYCPVNISFGIFKNLPLEKTDKNDTNHINNSSSDKIALRKNKFWSQDGYYKKKPLSNVQKINFTVDKSHIINESATFKLAIRCHPHKLLTEIDKMVLPEKYRFSIVLRIRENVAKSKLTGKLYQEIQLVNNLDSLLSVDADIDLEN